MMGSPEGFSANERSGLPAALWLARLVLEGPTASTTLGQGFQAVRQRSVGNMLRGNWAKVVTGYCVDTTVTGLVVTPRGLDARWRAALAERAAIGVRRIARAAVLRLPASGWPVTATLTEYRPALLRTLDGLAVPVTRPAVPVASDLSHRMQYGVEVLAGGAPDDALYTFEATSPSSDGRPPDTRLVEIAFSAGGVLSYAELGQPVNDEHGAPDQQKALARLTGYLIQMPSGLPE